MKKLFYLLLALGTLASSCGQSYEITGTSTVSHLDGQKLYLKVSAENELIAIDSCDVVHGRFSFSGRLDSTRLATVYMDERSLLPVVLENGKINIRIDHTQQICSGTPMNDKLTEFLKHYNQIASQRAELVHLHDQAIMNGSDMGEIVKELNQRALQLENDEDKLVTSFITDNFDNTLGPGVFMMMTGHTEYPMLSPWIEDIMSKATDRFKNDPYVKSYYEKAKENEAIMNGTKEMPRK